MKRFFLIGFYVMLFLLIIAYSTTAKFFDFDLWARLIAGMGVIDGHQVLKADFLSYTPTHIWYDHEWGSGVVFYSFLKHFGPYSLIILQSVLIFGIFYFVSKFIRLRYDKPYNILFYLFALYAGLTNFNQPVRCHLFSFMLFAMFLYLLEFIRKKDKPKLLFLLPPIVVLWNNLHGGVVSGIGLIIMYAVGTFLNDRKDKLWLKYLITATVSFVLLIINPWGIEYIKFLLMANTMQRTYITEWRGLFSSMFIFSPIFVSIKIYMLFILSVVGITFVKQIKSNSLKIFLIRADKVKLIVFFVTLFLAIEHVKLIPLFVVSSVAFVYEDFYELIKNIKMPKYKNILIYSLLLFVIAVSFFVKEFSLPLSFDGRYPVREVEFIKINNLKGNLLTDFGLGSYISYKLYPHNKIFMDGRYEEVYPDEYIKMLDKFFTLKKDGYEIVEKYPPDIILVGKNYAAFDMLKQMPEWYLIFEGRKYGVFIPTKNLKQKYIIPTKNIKYYKDTLFDTDIKF